MMSEEDEGESDTNETEREASGENTTGKNRADEQRPFRARGRSRTGKWRPSGGPCQFLGGRQLR